MPTALQNTEVETSLIQQAEIEEGLKSFNPLDGELIEDDDNTPEEGEEAPSEEGDGEEEKLPEGDLVEDAKYLKQMSNEAFEHFAKKTEETSALQQKLDSTSDKERVTADHPDSYILSEDYKEIYGKLSQAQQEQQHWRSQLLKIRNGDAWQNVEGYNDKGQLVMQKESFKPTQILTT